MILNISKEYNREMVENTVNLATHFLQVKSTHFFIASNYWDEINIEIDDDIPVGSLLHIGALCNNIKVSLPEVTTEHTLKLLIELYPDLAGKLRMSYLRTRDVRGVLGDCLVR